MAHQWIVFTVLLAIATSASAEDIDRPSAMPAIDQATIEQANRLLETAASLRSDGQSADAEELLQEAMKLMRPALEALEEKRAQAAKLIQDIAELEKLLDSPAAVRLQVRGYEIPIDLWHTVKPEALNDQPGESISISEEWLADFAELKENQGPISVTINFDATLKAGVGARFKSGGEFPIPVPNADGTVSIQWREFGEIIQATATVRGLGAVALQMSLEHSERIDEDAVEINGVKIPGLKTRKIQTKFETRFDETVLVQIPDGEGKVLIYLITPQRADKPPAK